MTYALQIFATLFMVAALVLGSLAYRSGNYPLVIINLVLFAVNGGLFYWQHTIRATYGL